MMYFIGEGKINTYTMLLGIAKYTSNPFGKRLHVEEPRIHG